MGWSLVGKTARRNSIGAWTGTSTELGIVFSVHRKKSILISIRG